MYSISTINMIEMWCKLNAFVGHKIMLDVQWIGAHMIHTNIEPEIVLILNMNIFLAMSPFSDIT